MTTYELLLAVGTVLIVFGPILWIWYYDKTHEIPLNHSERISEKVSGSSKLQNNLLVQTILRLIPFFSIGLALFIWYKYVDPEGQISTIKGSVGWGIQYSFTFLFLLSSFVIVQVVFKKIIKQRVIPTWKQVVWILTSFLLTSIAVFFTWTLINRDDLSWAYALQTTLYELIFPLSMFIFVFGIGVGIYLGLKKLVIGKI